MLGCDGSGPDDGGVHPGFDVGPPIDTGVDAAIDAGPDPMFRVRVVHDVVGMEGTDEAPGAAHLCAWLMNGERLVPVPPTFLTESTGPIPFRGVSPYVPFFVVDPLDYRIGVYEPAALAAGCPADPDAADAPRAVHLGRIAPGDVPDGSTSSVLTTGLARGSLGAAEGELPAICDPTPDPAPFDAPCGDALEARLAVVRDDLRPPAAGMAKLRVSNQIPNIAPLGFNVCYEASLVPDTAGPPGRCVDADGSDAPAVLFSNVRYGEVTEYVERAPIVPTVPASGAGGAIFLVPETGGTGCPPFSLLPASAQRCLPILAAFPTPPPADNIRPHLADGDVTTLMISGALGLSGDDAAAFGSLLFLWQDDFVAP